ncbi:MAG: hypothetical protein RSB99_03030 [Bacilli bacterium]
MYQNGFFPYSNYGASIPKTGGGIGSLLTGIKPKFNFNSFLTGTQKTLGLINQAIPIVNQVRPIWNNAKTMFRVMGALKEDTPSNPIQEPAEKLNNNNSNSNSSSINYYSSNNNPQFFL